MILPRIYRITADRDLRQLQNDLLMFQEDRQLRKLRSGSCIFDPAKACSHCFRCIGLIDQKKPAELSAVETARLLEYKIYQLNFSSFSKKLSENFLKNGGYEEIRCSINCDTDQMFSVTVTACNEKRGTETPVEYLGKGMRSIYMLSLLETYVAEPDRIPSIILVEDPEIFLHPQLQKMCCEILYRLSLKNQVIFQTHSPDLLFNFTARQIRQVVLDDDMYSVIREKTDLGRDFTSPEDMKDHMEEIRIHLRGHNLYDIFYGPFRSREQEILKAYIRLAPRDDFKDILDAIDSFPYFDSRKSGKQH